MTITLTPNHLLTALVTAVIVKGFLWVLGFPFQAWRKRIRTKDRLKRTTIRLLQTGVSIVMIAGTLMAFLAYVRHSEANSPAYITSQLLPVERAALAVTYQERHQGTSFDAVVTKPYLDDLRSLITRDGQRPTVKDDMYFNAVATLIRYNLVTEISFTRKATRPSRITRLTPLGERVFLHLLEHQML